MVNTLWIRWMCRVYFAALYVYPRPFRQRYGNEMQQLFRDRCREIARSAGSARWPRFVLRSAADWMGSVVREYMDGFSVRGFARAAARHVASVWSAGRHMAPRGAVAEWTFTILAFLFLSTTLVQAYVVPTGSMEGTILVGDHLLVDRVTYANPGVFHHVMPYHDVQRGDIVVIVNPELPSQTLVKRVIGLPGDHLRLEDKQVIRNGRRLIEPYVKHIDAMADPYRDDFPTAPGALTTMHGVRMFEQDVRNGELTVPPDTLFAMGDNRDNSFDSRYFGPVPRANVLGKPLLVYWSYDAPTADLEAWRFRHFVDVFEHFFSRTRWQRTFLVPRAERAEEAAAQ